MGCFLYAMSCPRLDEGIIKIGIAKNVESRVRALQIGCPYPIKVLSLWRYDNTCWARHAEKACHERFDWLNTHGEWFRVELASLALFLKEYNANASGNGVQIPIGNIRTQRKAAERLPKPAIPTERKPREIKKAVKTIPKDVASQILAHRRLQTSRHPNTA